MATYYQLNRPPKAKFCFFYSMKFLQKIKYLLLCLLLGSQLSATSNAIVGDTTKNYSLIVLPLVFSTPETSWGFGGATNVTFRFKGEPKTTRPSQFQLGFAYTLNQQFLSYLPFQLFFNEEKYKLYGELGYYRYVYFYYGNGNNTKEADRELFNVNFPRIRLNGLYGINKSWFIGLRYWLEDYDIVGVKEGGLLNTNNDIVGRAGGLLSGGGLVVNYDTRDHLFTPREGILAELVLFGNQKFLGSDFNFQKMYLDIAAYFPIGKNQTLAAQIYTELTTGEVPFNQLSLLGGTKRMRGYLEGRFRDKQYFTSQIEYRVPLFWRLGMTAFVTTGRVGPTVGDLFDKNWYYTYGLGLRIMLDTEARVNLRLDVGFGEDTSGFYLTFGEAF